jgi:hypothetical protein
VIRDIDDIIGWLEDSDPSRRTTGRRIQVDDRELERAVIPITLQPNLTALAVEMMRRRLGDGSTCRIAIVDMPIIVPLYYTSRLFAFVILSED